MQQWEKSLTDVALLVSMFRSPFLRPYYLVGLLSCDSTAYPQPILIDGLCLSAPKTVV